MIEALLAATVIVAPPLSALLERVRVVVPDAREVRDVQVCAPQQISRDGRRYTVLVALARPRSARSYYRTEVRNGRFVDMRSLGLAGDAEGLEGLAVRALDRRFEPCRWVTPEELAAGWGEIDR